MSTPQDPAGATAQAFRVDIISDVVCPWCAIGYYQLAAAAKELKVALDIHWHPFELNPHMASEGENLREHLAAKYGTTPEGSRQARARLTALGAELGFTFNYADDMRMWNTFQAHQLLDWAEEQGLGHATKLALFGAYFTERRNVSDIDVLVDVAAQVGLDGEAARAVLSSNERADQVRARQRVWLDQGISGVPTMVFEERYASTGAQGVDNYRSVLARLQADSAA